MAATEPPDVDNQDSGQEEELHGQMSFFDHLEELRNRLINIVIIVAIGFCASWWKWKDIFTFLTMPVNDLGIGIITTEITGAFQIAMEVCFYSALFIGAPFIIREIWLFVGPALYKREKRYAYPFILSAYILFLCGITFGYYVAFPLAAAFLIAFARETNITVLPTVDKYFDLFLMFELMLGIVFEIPAVIFVLSRIGLVTGPFLLRNFQYAVLLTAIIAAVATPTTDIPNMMMIAVPMLGLYIVGIGVAYIFGKRKPKDEE